MESIDKAICKLLDSIKIASLKKDINSLQNHKLIKQFFVSHHQDSIQITLIRKDYSARFQEASPLLGKHS